MSRFRSWPRVALAVSLALLPTLALASHFEFEVDGPFATESFPVNPFTFDFNDDGHADIAVSRGLGLSLLLGDGGGGFAPNQSVELGVGVNSLGVGDFDEDGNSDLLLGTFGTTVELHLGDGAGGYVLGLSISDPLTEFREVAVADFDADDDLDFVVTRNSTPSFLDVYLGNGDGTFAPPLALASQAGPRALLVSDLDGNGSLDIGVGRYDFVTNTGGVSIYHGDGGGGFDAELEITTGLVVELSTGDYDLNGSPDLMVLSRNNNPLCGNTATVFLADGGGYTPGQSFTGGCGPHTAITVDFDLDGIEDLVTTDGGDLIAAANVITIFEGVGDGTFVDPLEIALGLFVLAPPVVADFNEDGLPDLATSDLGAVVSVFRNTTDLPAAPFRRGDVDADGVFNGLLDGFFLLSFQFIPGSPEPPCLDAADFDDSGVVNGLVDGIATLNFQFLPGSPPPPPPGAADCGDDPTLDVLGCLSYPGCP